MSKLYFVYVIQSQVDWTFYKGFTTDPVKRLEEHNLKQSRFTSKKTPWKLVYLKEFKDKREALVYEKKIKRMNTRNLKLMIENNHLPVI